MLQRFSIFALLLCALNSSHAAHAKDSAAQISSRKAITASYAKMDGAVLKKDINTLMSYIAPDFQYFNQQRVVSDRARFGALQQFAARQNVRFTISKTNITKWQWRGPDAIVWTTSHNRIVGPGGVVNVSVQNREYWGKIGNRWLMRQSVELGASSTLNGKPFISR